MSVNPYQIVIPSPLQIGNQTAIHGPTEASFIAEFGALLPPAQFLSSAYGETAVYSFSPAVDSPLSSSVFSDRSPVQRAIFVHGVGTPALGLLPIVKALQASNPHLHLLLYDLWGHGLSSTPLVPHVPGLFHGQIIQLLQYMKWPSAHILGFSFGGSTAASFTAIHPTLVESCVLVAPAGLVKLGTFTEQERALINGGPGVDETEAGTFIVDWVSGGPLVVKEDWKAKFADGEISGEPIQVWERKMHRGHLASIVSMFRSGGISHMHESFKTVGRNTGKRLVIIGGNDDLVTENDLNEVGWDDVVVVPKAGHSLVRDRVAEVAAPINAFWKTLE